MRRLVPRGAGRVAILVAALASTLVACGSSDDARPAATTTSTTAPSTTSGPTASTYDTVPLVTTGTEPTETTVPAEMTALRPDGIGFLSIGTPVDELLASGAVTNPHPGCEGATEDDQFDLAIDGLTGVVAIVGDEADSFTISSGKVAGGGSIGMTADEFAAAGAGSYDWDVDETFAGSHGIWIGTLTKRSTGETIDVAIDPESKVVEEASAPAIAFCG